MRSKLTIRRPERRQSNSCAVMTALYIIECENETHHHHQKRERKEIKDIKSILILKVVWLMKIVPTFRLLHILTSVT